MTETSSTRGLDLRRLLILCSALPERGGRTVGILPVAWEDPWASDDVEALIDDLRWLLAEDLLRTVATSGTATLWERSLHERLGFDEPVRCHLILVDLTVPEDMQVACADQDGGSLREELVLWGTDEERLDERLQCAMANIGVLEQGLVATVGAHSTRESLPVSTIDVHARGADGGLGSILVPEVLASLMLSRRPSVQQDLLCVTVSRPFRERVAGDEVGPYPHAQEFLNGYLPPM